MARHEESSQSTCTRRWDEPSTSTSKRTRRLRSGHVPERALERPDIFQFVGCGSKTPFVTRVVRLRKVKGTDNEADMGTKDLDGPTHQRQMQKLPLKPTQCRRLLGLIATANGGSVVEAQMDGDKETLGKFFSTSDDCDTDSIGDLGPDGKRQLEATALGKTVERGTQTEFTVPTNVYCSPGGDCYHTSRKCEGLKNLPVDGNRRRRSCLYCIQRNGQ